MDILLSIPKELSMLVVSLVDISSMFTLSCSSKLLENFLTKHLEQVLTDTPTQVMFFPIIKLKLPIVLIDVITQGYTNLFKWLIPNSNYLSQPKIYIQHYLETAALNGSFDILKYIHKINLDTMDLDLGQIVTSAVKGNHFEILDWLYQKGCPLTGDTFKAAAESGNMKIIDYLRINKCQWDKDVCAYAAAG